MLTAFTVENYRSFLEKTRIELRPLTLLFGYNNSGKSALVRALPLLADSMRSDATGPLNMGSEAVRGSVFGDLVSRLGDSNTIRFGLEFDTGMAVDYEVTRPAGSFRLLLTSASIQDPRGGPMKAELMPGADTVGANTSYRVTRGGDVTNMRNPFRGLSPAVQAMMEFEGPTWSQQIMFSFGRLLNGVAGFAGETLWLGSLRHHPERFARLREGGAAPRLSNDGSGVAEILALDKLSGGELLADVSAWYERQDCFKRGLTVIQSANDLFSVVLDLSGKRRSVQVNVADTGEGIAQVLPVLVAAAMAGRKVAERPRLLVFEQPELHLHTAIHAPLAERLCQLAAMDEPPHMLVETHSENFLLGVQIQIAKGKLPPERVRIYWVEQDEDGASQVVPIDLDAEGFARGFPHDVFDKDVELSRSLFDAREHAAT